jgi:hypothetical protein
MEINNKHKQSKRFNDWDRTVCPSRARRRISYTEEGIGEHAGQQINKK